MVGVAADAHLSSVMTHQTGHCVPLTPAAYSLPSPAPAAAAAAGVRYGAGVATTVAVQSQLTGVVDNISPQTIVARPNVPRPQPQPLSAPRHCDHKPTTGPSDSSGSVPTLQTPAPPPPSAAGSDESEAVRDSYQMKIEVI